MAKSDEVRVAARLRRPRRSRRTLVAVGVLVVAASSAAGAWLAQSTSGENSLTRSEYLARVSTICNVYGRELDRIPPPDDIASIGNVFDSVRAALPIVKEQAARIRALHPPAGLRAVVAQFFAATDRSIAALEGVERAARSRSVARVGIGLQHYAAVTVQAKLLARKIGYRC
jgi:hypothetical protein